MIIASPDELALLVEQAVERALSNHAQLEGWLDTKAAADYLSTTAQSIRDMVRRQRLPHHRAPGTSRLLFKASELDAFVLGGGS